MRSSRDTDAVEGFGAKGETDVTVGFLRRSTELNILVAQNQRSLATRFRLAIVFAASRA